MTPLWTQVRAWFLETLKRAHVAPRMGLTLYSSFIAAGLPAPELRLECALSGSEVAAWAGLTSSLGYCRLWNASG
jgi:hypothetical protein